MNNDNSTDSEYGSYQGDGQMPSLLQHVRLTRAAQYSPEEIQIQSKAIGREMRVTRNKIIEMKEDFDRYGAIEPGMEDKIEDRQKELDELIKKMHSLNSQFELLTDAGKTIERISDSWMKIRVLPYSSLYYLPNVSALRKNLDIALTTQAGYIDYPFGVAKTFIGDSTKKEKSVFEFNTIAYFIQLDDASRTKLGITNEEYNYPINGERIPDNTYQYIWIGVNFDELLNNYIPIYPALFVKHNPILPLAHVINSRVGIIDNVIDVLNQDAIFFEFLLKDGSSANTESIKQQVIEKLQALKTKK